MREVHGPSHSVNTYVKKPAASSLVSLFPIREGGGGYSQKSLVGVCGPLPKTLTLL